MSISSFLLAHFQAKEQQQQQQQAYSYLARHQLHFWVEEVLESLAAQQPADPWTFIESRLPKRSSLRRAEEEQVRGYFQSFAVKSDGRQPLPQARLTPDVKDGRRSRSDPMAAAAVLMAPPTTTTAATRRRRTSVGSPTLDPRVLPAVSTAAVSNLYSLPAALPRLVPKPPFTSPLEPTVRPTGRDYEPERPAMPATTLSVEVPKDPTFSVRHQDARFARYYRHAQKVPPPQRTPLLPVVFHLMFFFFVFLS